tara:strand:- start:1262 stop:1933 length:672 start_codon:yes stop_codon:yes gene_type:complete
MCGVIGYSPREGQTIEERNKSRDAFKRLFHESTVRGKHYYGIAQVKPPSPDGFSETFNVWRSRYKASISDQFTAFTPTVAHTRFSQSGDWQVKENNQPIIVSQRALAMNGVIHMGTKQEYEQAFDVYCTVDNDAEIFLRCLEKDQDASNFINTVEGSFAGVWITAEQGLFAVRNARRPLWVCKEWGAIWIASTRDIFLRSGFSEKMNRLEPGIVFETSMLEAY